MIHHCEKTNICLLCGDKGDPKCNVYCAQCKACAQHSYCLDKFYTEDDGTIIWKCEDCAPHNPKRCGSEELRKSKRLTDITEAKNRRLKMQKESLAVRKPKSVRSSEGFLAECLRKKDIEKRQPILEDNDIFYEEPESIKCPINVSTDRPSCARPLNDPVWTGQFILNNTTDFGLVMCQAKLAQK